MPAYGDYPTDPVADSRMFSSISSLTSNPTSRQQQSNIAKSYRQAAQLFLTRRLPEALSTIEPVITPQPSSNQHNGHLSEEEEEYDPAPIASATRGTRIKVWSFYLTFLNAVVELGPEEGKHAFGSAKWKLLVAKCRDGSIWDEVVRDGYHGIEGEVDPDVVVNLATLLLTHSPDQRLNQSRLETYISATSNPNFNISQAQMSGNTLTRRHSNSSHHNGTSTPRDLNTRLKILELYTLHILPRNQEWQYARDFIAMSEVLDEERKEAFLQALTGLQEDSEATSRREQALAREREQQLEAQRKREEELKRQEEEREKERRRKEEEERKRPPTKKPEAGRPSQLPGPTDHGRRIASPPARPVQRGGRANNRSPAKKSRAGPITFVGRAAALVAALRMSLLGTARGMRRNPMAYIRSVLFLLAFLLAFAREDIRERVKAWLKDAWDRVKRTIGMGVKVSYI